MNTPAESLPADIAPGLYDNISNELYHTGPGLSSSGVKLIVNHSPLHYWDKYLNPDREREDQTPALIVGSATHTLVFEPEKFDQEYAVEPPNINKRTKDGKATLATFLQANEGKTILTQAQHAQASLVAGSVRNNPKCAQYLEEGKAEQSLYWTDPDTGVLCKCRPDWWRDVMLADLKTTINAGPDEFERAIYKYGYHISAAMYLDGIRVTYGEDLPFVFMVAEKDSPFAVANYLIHDEALALGRKKFRAALEIYARCMEKGVERKHWPGYPLETQPINIPAWAYRKA